MKKQHIQIIVIFLAGIIIPQNALSQTIDNEFQSRTELNLKKELSDKLDLYIIPEIRWDQNFSADKYLLESQLNYKVLKGLSIAGGYRFIINPRDTKSTEYLHRIAFHTEYKKKFGRLTPSLRLKYTNYSDDDDSGDYLKYRAKLSYNLPKSKLTPTIAAEGYYDFSGKNIYKYRYSTGFGYKLNKQHSIKIDYMFDYYMQEYKNKQIVNLKYKYTF